MKGRNTVQKRIISAALFLIMLVSLCACGNKEDTEQQTAEAEKGLIDGWIAEAIPIPEDMNGWDGTTEEFSLSEGIIYFGIKKNGFPAIISYDTQNGSWGEITYDTSGLSDLTGLRDSLFPMAFFGHSYAIIRNMAMLNLACSYVI